MKKVIVLFAAILILQGCQEENSIMNSPQGDQIYKEFTISGSADGITVNPFGPNAPFRRFEGTGESTPGGNAQLVLDYLVTSFTFPNGTSGFGSGVLTMENGDKLYAIQASGNFTIVGTTVTITASAHIAGGTGEYDNITGNLTYSGTLEQTTGATHAEWTGTFTREKPFYAELTAENVTVSGSCGTGYLRRHAEGSGKAAHMGKTLITLDHCINPTTGIIADGNDMMEAANGDKIYFTHNGYALPIPGTNTAAINMFATITGGEGRFANATGYIWAKGTQVLPEGTAQCILDGVIDY